VTTGNSRQALLIAVLVGCGMGVSLIFTAIGPVLSTIATHYGGDTRGNIIAQLMMTLPSIGVILGGPTVGLVARRWGTPALLYAALATYGVTGCAGFLVQAEVPLLATRFLLGIAAVGVATASTTLIGNLLEGPRRVRTLGYSSAVASIGAIGSIFIAGELADYGGWHLPFLIYSFALVLLVLAVMSVPRQARDSSTATAAASTGFSWLQKLWPLYLSVAAVTIVVFMTGIQVSFLLAANGITQPGDQAWIIASASLGATLGALLYGPLQQSLGRDWTFALCLLAMGAGNLVMGSQELPILLALGCLLNGLGAGMTVPHFSSRIIEVMPPEVRPQALGFMFTMIFAGEFLNPWVVTPIRMGFGIATAFLVIGSLALAAATYLILARIPRTSAHAQ
jgi:MFS family permease